MGFVLSQRVEGVGVGPDPPTQDPASLPLPHGEGGSGRTNPPDTPGRRVFKRLAGAFLTRGWKTAVGGGWASGGACPGEGGGRVARVLQWEWRANGPKATKLYGQPGSGPAAGHAGGPPAPQPRGAPPPGPPGPAGRTGRGRVGDGMAAAPTDTVAGCLFWWRQLGDMRAVHGTRSQTDQNRACPVESGVRQSPSGGGGVD